MFLITPVMPEGYKGPVATFPYEGDDLEKAKKHAMNFFEENPITCLNAIEIEIVRVVETEPVATLEVPKQDMKKLLQNALKLMSRDS